MRTLIVAVMLLMFFGVGRAQEPLSVPVEPREGAMAISQVQKLAPPDAGRFGFSVDSTGNSEGSILVVGAPRTTVNSLVNAGAIFIYRMDVAGQWQFWQRIAAAPASKDTEFGYSVSVSGNGADARIAVGAPYEDYRGPDDGRVYVFRLEGDVWLTEAIFHDLTQPVTSQRDFFGESVSLSEDGMTLAIGEPDPGIAAPTQPIGFVHIYERSNTDWSFETIVYPPDNAYRFGKRVELVGNGDNALMAVSSQSPGLYLFHRPYGVWQSEQKLTPFNGVSGIANEFSIAGLQGNRIIAATWAGDHAGAISIFRHDGIEWVQTQYLSSGNFTLSTQYFSAFGNQIALGGNASDATLYVTLTGPSSPYWQRVLRIKVTPSSATLQEEIISPEPSEAGFASDLFIPPATSGEIVYASASSVGTGIVHVLGNEPGVQISPGAITVIEGGPGASYAISLSTAPTADVTIVADAADGCDAGTGKGQPVTQIFTPANWNTPQSITVQAAPDNVPEAGIICLITHNAVSGDSAYNGITISTVQASVYDPPVTFADIMLTNHEIVAATEGGSADSYNVSLVYKPTYPVQIEALPDAQCDLGAGAGQAVTFTYSVEAWQTPAVVTVNATDDTVNEGTHTCTISHTVSGPVEYAGLAVPNVTATITDNDAANLIVNGDFESGTTPWTVRNKTGDKVLCDTTTRSAAYAGSCAFRFKGGVGENASLTQNVDLSGVVFGASDALRLQAMISGGAAAKGKLKLRVLYVNGEDTVVKLALPTTGAYALTESAWVLLDSELVAALTVTIQHKSTKGKVWVDNVALWHRPVIVLRDVPAAADGFRAP